MSPELRPIARSALRLKVGKWYYVTRRYGEWMFGGVKFAKRRTADPLPSIVAKHRTPLLRKLGDSDMQLQRNKIVNLQAALPRLDGILLHPGETLSYWRLLGKPTRRKGYVNGMVLFCGEVRKGLAGGLCQLSNLIYWMTLHTGLTVTERHRHSYDVFPDARRTQPFGSGATCSYNYLDLRIKNRTSSIYQLRLSMDDEYLYGAWHAEQPERYRYEVRERNHRMTQEPWGGYVRHNELYRDVYTADGEWLLAEEIAENHALMMYSPLLQEPSGEAGEVGEKLRGRHTIRLDGPMKSRKVGKTVPFDFILQRFFPSGCWEIEQGHSGWNNTTRFVRADGRRWVLRIYETHKDEDKVRFEHRLLEKLNEVNLSFRVPRPAACSDRNTIVRLEDGTERLACLFAYLEGERPAEGNAAAAQSLGEATAELIYALGKLNLTEAAAYAPYYEMESSYPWCTPDKVARFCEEAPVEFAEEAKALRFIGEELNAFRAFLPRFRTLPHQLIHGDINFSNCLTAPDNTDRIGSILDFEFCTRDLRAMEIAVVVSGFLDADNGREMIHAFLRGAGSRVRLSPEEAEAIPHLIRLRTLDVFLHFLNRYFDGVDGIAVLKEQTTSASSNLRKLNEESEWLATAVEALY